MLSSWSMSSTTSWGCQSARRSLRLGEGLDGADDEHAVVEGELDEVDDQRPVVKHQGPLRLKRLRFRPGHTHACVSCTIRRGHHMLPAGSSR